MRRALALALLVCAAAALLAVAGLRRELSPPEPGARAEVPVVVPAGAGLKRIARQLEEAGVVRSARAFELLARWRGDESRLRSGEYLLSPALPAAEVLARIASGRVRLHELVVPEGFTAAQIATRLAELGLADPDAFLARVRDPDAGQAFGVEGPGLEGYLFPDTYRLARGLPVDEILRTLVAPFLETWAGLAPRAQALGMSQREVTTLASIIEKETGVPAERPLISAVFHNRLKRGMRLETDPTVIYGIADFDGNLRRVHLEDASNPYNTYRIAGLPPGPIASPGREALRAAVEPADVDYLYFVARGDGTHVFSRSYADHAAAVSRFQRGGR